MTAPPDVGAPAPDAVVTSTGLAYKVLRRGRGTQHPTSLSRVEAHYTGWTADGTMFDSTSTRGHASTFGLDKVIKGWAEGLQLMVPGEKARLWIPEALAYQGRAGMPAGMLVFDIELVAIHSEARPETLTLDGVKLVVKWDDGDTFATLDRKVRARLVGYNTLESYGPVHRWGDWSAKELYGNALAAGIRAAGGTWTCETVPGGGGYGRVAVDCPDLRATLLREGLAHTFGVDGPADPGDQAIQAKAMAQGVGMWAKGTPDGIVTSVHSLDEREGAVETYDRVCSTSTGSAPKVSHALVHPACTEVCHDGSCLLYVPYKQRYGDRKADCLK